MQKLRFSKYFKSIVILLDLILLATLFLLYFWYRNQSIHLTNFDWETHLFLILLLAFFWLLLSGRTKLYNIPRNLTYTLYLERIISHILIFLFGIILLGKVSDNVFLKNERFSLAIFLSVLFFVVKSSIFFILKFLRKFGVNYRNVMFIGANDDSGKILKNILRERKDYGLKIFEYSENEINIQNLLNFWKENGIFSVFMSSSDDRISSEVREEIYKNAELQKVKINLIPDLFQQDYFRFELNYVETQPILVQTKFPLEIFTNYLLKRLFDVVFSIVALLCIGTWLVPLIAILIRLDSKGPVFFLQKRYGFHDHIFNCIKFRTMVVNEESASSTTQENDNRITRVGKFLRKSSLDEFPQFINVILGQMSVVGPRPHMLLIDDLYKTKIGRYTLRSLVKPGITGLAQVSGLRGDKGDMNIEMKKRILADAFYVKNWTLTLDIIIILKTIKLLVLGDKNAR